MFAVLGRNEDEDMAADFDDVIFKIVTSAEWEEPSRTGVFEGAPIDIADGYIHFSRAGQVRETAAKHFGGQRNLLLVSVRSSAVVADLKYEPSRGGELFPHLYGKLPLSAVIAVESLLLGADGYHQFPDRIVLPSL